MNLTELSLEHSESADKEKTNPSNKNNLWQKHFHEDTSISISPSLYMYI